MRKAALLATLALAGCSIGSGGNDDAATGVATSAPTSSQSQAAAKLGFPTVATRNTIRVGGGDPIADLAGTAAAVFPATDDQSRPHAVVLVDKDDWQGAVAASVLNANPLGAPVLASDGGSLPAASWAARSGDSVLYTRRDRVPVATMQAIAAHSKPDIYVLGPESVISPAVEKQLRRVGTVRRVAGPTPVANAVALARYSRRGFGWGVTVPGYNFVLASTSRPLDAAAAATLATNGVFAPLLLTNAPAALPSEVSGYLLDV